MKNIYFIILLIVFLAVTVWLVWSYKKYAQVNTARTQTMLDLQVSGGTLGENIVPGMDGTPEVELAPVILSGSDTTTSGLLNTMVKDHRGTEVGWTQTLSCSDFTKDGQVIAVSNLTVGPQIIIPIGESDLSGVFLGADHTLVDPSDQAVIMYAVPGAGGGRFEAESELSLLIDQLTLPGKYKAEVTVTIV